MGKNPKFKFIILLVALTFFAYLSSIGGPFIWDDEQFITSNQYVQQFDIGKLLTTNTIAGAGVVSNYYRPLTSISFAFDTWLWGKNTVPFHLVNLSLHIGTGLLLFYLLMLLGMGELPAFFISLFFLIFPTQTEAVSYINSRGDSMFSLLLLGSVVTWILAMKTKKTSYYWIGVILFVLSILGKETALFGLLLFPVILWKFGEKHGQKLMHLFKEQKLFLFSLTGISVIYFLLRVTVLNFQNTLNYYPVQDIYSTSLFVRLFTFCKILFVYLGILIFPYPLHMERSVSYIIGLSWWVVGAIVLVIGLLWLGYMAYKKTKNPWILFGFFWSSVFLIPVSGIIPINGLLYEHWLYLPMVGFWIMLYGISIFALQFLSKKAVWKKIMISFGIVLSILYIFLTIRQNNVWADAIGFYQYTLSYAPYSARLHNNLANTYAALGAYDKAIAEYKKTIQLIPNQPQAYNNLGNTYYTLKQYDLAEKYLLYSLKLSPNFTYPRNNLVKLYLTTHQYDKALKISNNNPQVEEYIKELQSQSK